MTRHLNLMGLLGLGTRGLPGRIADVTHHAFIRWPDACPKCGNLILDLYDRRAYCRLCGWDAYLVSDRLEVRPRRVVDGARADPA